jgi:putative hemolysin
MAIAITTLIILIIINAFFAASEIALIGLNENKVKQKAEAGNKKYGMLYNLISEPSRFLSTIQIGITLAGFMASAFAADFFAEPLAGWLDTLGLPLSYMTLHTVSVVLITIVLSYFTLVLGELVPKKLALQKSEQISLAIARPLTWLFKLFTPVVKILTASTNGVVRLLGGDPHAKDDDVTEEEIRMMVEVGGERGTIDRDEKTMVHRVFEFDDKIVSNIFTHRLDIAALPADASLKETITQINQNPYSRFPVYEGSLDNIIGVLHTKDLFRYIDGFRQKDFSLRKVIRKPYFVTETRKIDELFASMKRKNAHIAIVIDEYGGTEGLVTIEDIIEEIVGEISAEDIFIGTQLEVNGGFEKISPTEYAVSGIIGLYQLEEMLRIGLPVQEFDTLNGFLINQIGYLPTPEEKAEVTYGDVTFKISKVADNRIEAVIMQLPKKISMPE